MAELGRYCKAFPASRFRAFAGWSEKLDVTPLPATGEAFFYLHDNLCVTDGVFRDEHVIFDQVTPEWERFCRDTLQFEVPAWAAGADET
jgi:hypothetical protein